MVDEIKDKDLVSIIMPSYNCEKYIEESIKSVVSQTYDNLELIIVDDCSTDNTDKIIDKLKDKRIKYIKNEKTSGAAFSRNIALKEAKGKWIAFLDSDDIWEKDKLEKQIKFMNEHDYHFSYTQYSEIDETDNLRNVSWTGPKKISKLLMYTFNYMGCLTVMYDQEFVGLIQIPDLKKRNDYAIWLKVVKKCPAYLLEENLGKYRVRKTGSITNRKKSPLSRLKYNYIMYRKSENMNIFQASFFTCFNLVFGALKKVIYKRRS